MQFKCKGDIDLCSLLLSYWHDMIEEERKKVMPIIDKHRGECANKYLLDLIKECNICKK